MKYLFLNVFCAVIFSVTAFAAKPVSEGGAHTIVDVAQDISSEKAAINAIKKNDPQALEQVFASGLIDINAKLKGKSMLLFTLQQPYWGFYGGDKILGIVQTLIDHGADVKEIISEKNTQDSLLSYSIMRVRPAVALALIQAGADVNFSAVFPHSNHHGVETVLDNACEQLRRQASMNEPGSIGAGMGRPEVIKQIIGKLVEAGAQRSNNEKCEIN
jgi:hypothetical protein